MFSNTLTHVYSCLKMVTSITHCNLSQLIQKQNKNHFVNISVNNVLTTENQQMALVVCHNVFVNVKKSIAIFFVEVLQSIEEHESVSKKKKKMEKWRKKKFRMPPRPFSPFLVLLSIHIRTFIYLFLSSPGFYGFKNIFNIFFLPQKNKTKNNDLQKTPL